MTEEPVILKPVVSSSAIISAVKVIPPKEKPKVPKLSEIPNSKNLESRPFSPRSQEKVLGP